MRISLFITTILHCSDRESKTKKRKYVLTHSLISVQFFTSYKHKMPLDVITVRCCGLQFRWGRESLQEEEQNTQNQKHRARLRPLSSDHKNSFPQNQKALPSVSTMTMPAKSNPSNATALVEDPKPKPPLSSYNLFL